MPILMFFSACVAVVGLVCSLVFPLHEIFRLDRNYDFWLSLLAVNAGLIGILMYCPVLIYRKHFMCSIILFVASWYILNFDNAYACLTFLDAALLCLTMAINSFQGSYTIKMYCQNCGADKNFSSIPTILLGWFLIFFAIWLALDDSFYRPVKIDLKIEILLIFGVIISTFARKITVSLGKISYCTCGDNCWDTKRKESNKQ